MKEWDGICSWASRFSIPNSESQKRDRIFLFHLNHINVTFFLYIVCGESGGDEAHVMCLIYRWCTLKYGLLSLYFVVSSSLVTFHFYSFQTHFILHKLILFQHIFPFLPINNIQFIHIYVHTVQADLTSPYIPYFKIHLHCFIG